jgi:8-oxo-dGTP pyrophosphatase MutT (NUDIX family)
MTMTKKHVIYAFSAGGVVFRQSPVADALVRDGVAAPSIEIVIVGHVRENIWTLPKGTPCPNETRAETALREVREETGIEARIVGEVGSIEYTFARRGMRFVKTVFHYLMLATGGSVELHDHEYDEARWYPYPDVLAMLTYENESDMARRAEPLIRDYLASAAS